MGPDGVVLDPPVLHQRAGLQQAAEGVDGKQFIAQAATEAYHVGVLPPGARLDAAGPRADEPAPVGQGACGQLRAVVAADKPWRRAARFIATLVLDRLPPM